jgi:hypothetical protein
MLEKLVNNIFFKKKVLFLHNIIYLYNMGRKKIKNSDKKIRMSVTLDPIIENLVKKNHINLSSLVSELPNH